MAEKPLPFDELPTPKSGRKIYGFDIDTVEGKFALHAFVKKHPELIDRDPLVADIMRQFGIVGLK